MGTTDHAMGEEHGRVRGLSQVTVADAFLMPQIPRANTNIPAVIIGEQIATFLTAALQQCCSAESWLTWASPPSIHRSVASNPSACRVSITLLRCSGLRVSTTIKTST